jgi:hypothetical protein
VKPPPAAAHPHLALAAQRVHRPGGEPLRGRHGRERQRLRRAVAVLVLPERGKLAEQPLRGFSIVWPGLLGDVGAQRHDLTDRDLVRRTSPLHDHVFGYHARHGSETWRLVA